LKVFGGATAFYEDWLSRHPNKAQIYNLIFADLSTDILRFRDYYYYDNTSMAVDLDIYQNAVKSLGYPPKMLLSSWSPPPELKTTNSVNSGTLKQVNGQFVYNDFGQYWLDSLQRYRKLGINFTYISMQNEPNYNATWDSCYFMPQEQNSLPSYGKAFEAMYQSLLSFPNRPLLLAPEVIGFEGNAVQNYIQPINTTHYDGIDHHLYSGGDPTKPDTFITGMTQMQTTYPNIKKYQTEFFGGDWLQTSWLIHNSLAIENVVAYLYWSLVWFLNTQDGLIILYDPSNPNSWPNPQGYMIRKEYYGFKQYSAYINPTDIRINVTTTSTNLRASGYLNSQGNSLKIVIININTTMEENITFNLGNYGKISQGMVYQTSSKVNCSLIGNYSDGQNVVLPAYSVTTFVLNK